MARNLYEIDPAFSVDSLESYGFASSEYLAYLTVINSDSPTIDTMAFARTGDLFSSRQLIWEITTSLALLDEIGDAVLLDRIFEIVTEFNKHLKTDWQVKPDGTSSSSYKVTTDRKTGRRRWLAYISQDDGNVISETHYGTDMADAHVWHWHATYMLTCLAFKNNVGKVSPKGYNYGELYEFMRVYLLEFEALWASRAVKNFGIFQIRSTLTRVVISKLLYFESAKLVFERETDSQMAELVSGWFFNSAQINTLPSGAKVVVYPLQNPGGRTDSNLTDDSPYPFENLKKMGIFAAEVYHLSVMAASGFSEEFLNMFSSSIYNIWFIEGSSKDLAFDVGGGGPVVSGLKISERGFVRTIEGRFDSIYYQHYGDLLPARTPKAVMVEMPFGLTLRNSDREWYRAYVAFRHTFDTVKEPIYYPDKATMTLVHLNLNGWVRSVEAPEEAEVEPVLEEPGGGEEIIIPEEDEETDEDPFEPIQETPESAGGGGEPIAAPDTPRPVPIPRAGREYRDVPIVYGEYAFTHPQPYQNIGIIVYTKDWVPIDHIIPGPGSTDLVKVSYTVSPKSLNSPDGASSLSASIEVNRLLNMPPMGRIQILLNGVPRFVGKVPNPPRPKHFIPDPLFETDSRPVPPIAVMPRLSPLEVHYGHGAGEINTEYMYRFSAGRGRRVRIVCIDRHFLPHVDMPNIPIIAGANFLGTETTRNHGTTVFSIIAALHNEVGFNGIAPNAAFFGAGTTYSNFTSNAAIIRAVTAQLRPGDIIFQAMSRGGPNRDGSTTPPPGETVGLKGVIPQEWFPDDYLAIKEATNRGIIFVDGSGNGFEDLDAAIYDTPYSWFPSWWKNPFRRVDLDSGSIIVGAASPGKPRSTDWGTLGSRLAFSNYGSMVDTNFWGREMTIVSGMNFDTGQLGNWYYTGGSGTSVSIPAVAGVIALLQDAYIQARGKPLTPKQIRDGLRLTGRPQTSVTGRPSSQRIGNMVEGKQLFEYFGLSLNNSRPPAHIDGPRFILRETADKIKLQNRAGHVRRDIPLGVNEREFEPNARDVYEDNVTYQIEGLKSLADKTYLHDKSYSETAISEIVLDIATEFCAKQNIVLDENLIDYVPFITVSQEFNESTVLSALDSLAQLAGNIIWGVDPYGRFFFRHRTQQIFQEFMLGVDNVEMTTPEVNASEIVNAITVSGSSFQENGLQLKTDYIINQESIDEWGRLEGHYSYPSAVGETGILGLPLLLLAEVPNGRWYRGGGYDPNRIPLQDDILPITNDIGARDLQAETYAEIPIPGPVTTVTMFFQAQYANKFILFQGGIGQETALPTFPANAIGTGNNREYLSPDGGRSYLSIPRRNDNIVEDIAIYNNGQFLWVGNNLGGKVEATFRKQIINKIVLVVQEVPSNSKWWIREAALLLEGQDDLQKYAESILGFSSQPNISATFTYPKDTVVDVFDNIQIRGYDGKVELYEVDQVTYTVDKEFTITARVGRGNYNLERFLALQKREAEANDKRSKIMERELERRFRNITNFVVPGEDAISILQRYQILTGRRRIT